MKALSACASTLVYFAIEFRLLNLVMTAAGATALEILLHLHGSRGAIAISNSNFTKLKNNDSIAKRHTKHDKA